jgi:hypothetical protein
MVDDRDTNEPRLVTDGPRLYLIGGAILAVIVGFVIYSALDTPSNTLYNAQTAVAQVEEQAETPAAVTGNLGDKLDAGEFGITVSSAKITAKLDNGYNGVTTENQFVVVKVTVSNNDDRARDISKGMFTLVDRDNKTYKAYDVSGGAFLMYDTINPGLLRTRSVAFETPKGISEFALIADSGVALAAGETATIYLGELK